MHPALGFAGPLASDFAHHTEEICRRVEETGPGIVVCAGELSSQATVQRIADANDVIGAPTAASLPLFGALNQREEMS
jgi:hypothetical protein